MPNDFTLQVAHDSSETMREFVNCTCILIHKRLSFFRTSSPLHYMMAYALELSMKCLKTNPQQFSMRTVFRKNSKGQDIRDHVALISHRKIQMDKKKHQQQILIEDRRTIIRLKAKIQQAQKNIRKQLSLRRTARKFETSSRNWTFQQRENLWEKMQVTLGKKRSKMFAVIQFYAANITSTPHYWTVQTCRHVAATIR